MRKASSARILTAAVPRDVAEKIRDLARRDERTTSAYIRRILARHATEAGQ